MEINALVKNEALLNKIKALAEKMHNNINVVPKLPEIKIIHTLQKFQIEQREEKKLVCKILNISRVNELFDEEKGEDGEYVCSAVNSNVGYTYGDCLTCQYSKWGYNTKTGMEDIPPKCHQVVRLVLYVQGYKCPFTLKIPRTSASAILQSCATAESILGLPLFLLNAEFSLKEVKQGKNVYSHVEVRFTRPEELDETKVKTIIAMVENYQNYYEELFIPKIKNSTTSTVKENSGGTDKSKESDIEDAQIVDSKENHKKNKKKGKSKDVTPEEAAEKSSGESIEEYDIPF